MIWIKIKELTGSLRFWILTLGAVIAILEETAVGTLGMPFVFKTIEVWLGAVVALGTLDSVATKFGSSLFVTKAGRKR